MVTPTGIDTTFRRWTATAHRWATLPERIGLSSTRDGCWDAFIRLDANRDLPAFVVESIEIDAERLQCFTRAHHFAAMHGIVSDRIVDSQVADRELLEARAALLEAWVDAIATGLGDARAARGVVGRTLREWKRGVDLERRILTDQSDNWNTYSSSVALRLRWVAATAHAMLDSFGAPDAARALSGTYDCLMLALQIMDDRNDVAEDRRNRGTAFSCIERLDVDPRHLAGLLLVRAATHASSGGLQRLSSWLGEFSCILLHLPEVGRG